MDKDVSAKDFLIHLAKFSYGMPKNKKVYNYVRSHKVLNDFVMLDDEDVIGFVQSENDENLEKLITLVEDWWKENGKELEEWIKKEQLKF